VTIKLEENGLTEERRYYIFLFYPPPSPDHLLAESFL
jgi:hypothetical protein